MQADDCPVPGREPRVCPNVAGKGPQGVPLTCPNEGESLQPNARVGQPPRKQTQSNGVLGRQKRPPTSKNSAITTPEIPPQPGAPSAVGLTPTGEDAGEWVDAGGLESVIWLEAGWDGNFGRTVG